MSTGTRDSARLKSHTRRTRQGDGRWTTAPPPGRKSRTIFTEEQHSALLAAYDADKYPTTIQKELLARQLGLAPIVVINWFQHRRQREPVKEKGGYVKNNPHPAGISTGSPFIAINPLPESVIASTSAIPSFQEYFNKDGRPIKSDSSPDNPDTPKPTDSEGTKSPEAAPLAVSSAEVPVATTPTGDDTPKATPAPPTIAAEARPAPYYGRMQTVRGPNPAENGDAVPKSANAHIGTMRWELDPLYIAPYVDHGFKDAMLPKNPPPETVSFALRPSVALNQK